jgi:putative tryptophan/tyrosine transport system substrate-binding protein
MLKGAVLLLLGTLLGVSPAAAGEAALALVKSGSGNAYEEAEAGMREVLGARWPGASIEALTLGKGDSSEDVLRAIRAHGAKVVITLGDRATSALAPRLGSTPLVAGMVIRGDTLAASSNATGVALEFPASVELRWLHEMFPSARRVGVLYDPQKNAARIRDAERAAKRAGLELVARPVNSPQEIPDALKGLAGVDVIWGVPDETALSPATARTVLTFAFSNRIPISGLSTSWVKAGALYALDRDYRDIGRQCGELAAAILDGSAPASLPVQAPRTVLYSLNLRAFAHMKLANPERAVVAKATAVYQ